MIDSIIWGTISHPTFGILNLNTRLWEPKLHGKIPTMDITRIAAHISGWFTPDQVADLAVVVVHQGPEAPTCPQFAEFLQELELEAEAATLLAEHKAWTEKGMHGAVHCDEA